MNCAELRDNAGEIDNRLTQSEYGNWGGDEYGGNGGGVRLAM